VIFSRLEDAFDGDFGVDFFAQDAFEAAFDGHGGVGAAAAGATEFKLDGFAVDGDDFEVSAVGLEVDAEAFKFFGDLLVQVFHGEALPGD